MREIAESFSNPPVSCRPHTRWWWMGNAATKEDITWQLEQMRAREMGGVEQISMQEVYERGNVPYLSEEFFDLLCHAIDEAERLGLEFSVNFGGPGWLIGGSWLPPEDRSKNLLPTWVRLKGPLEYSGEVPTEIKEAPETGEMPAREIGPDDRLLAVVASRVKGDRLDEEDLVDLTPRVSGRRLEWEVPDGEWQLMAFWLKRTGQGHAIDHFSKGAMERYCSHLGGMFRDAFGEHFGRTVESFFVDSFEVALYHNGIYWSDDLLPLFSSLEGYDLRRYLPAIWWDVGEISEKVRYDVNHFLHRVGLEAFFDTFLGWCEENGVRGRIQPYGFTTDILEGAGRTHVPEMEITAGEKDAVPWFDTRIGPKKYVSSGAHLYGRDVVSVEAYTYLHWESYRGTLEELKIASDVFLKSGANKFYNHGYTCSPERDIAPSRRFESEVLISHSNVWWRYYTHLSRYVARCCYLLRQGRFVADIAVYSPLANQWALDVRNARSWTRGFDWGDLGGLLISNGYDFDLINDDAILNHARTEEGTIRVRDMEYRVLILPNIRAMPVETLRRIRDWVRDGGTVIALERVPEASVGMRDHGRHDAEVREIVGGLFDTPVWRQNSTAPMKFGRGCTYHIRKVIDRSNVLDRHASSLDPFLNVLRSHIAPDTGIDFVGEGIRENRGLTHVHRRTAEAEIYFLTNLQDRGVDMPLTFRVTGMVPSEWNPMTGRTRRLRQYVDGGAGTTVPISLPPYGSTFIVFNGDRPDLPHVTDSTLDEVTGVDRDRVRGLVSENGTHRVKMDNGRSGRVNVEGVPGPFRIEGEWNLTLEGEDFPRRQISMERLRSWTEDEGTRHFSGTGRYEIRFELPASFTEDDVSLRLDLGKVGNVAEVRLNGEDVGVVWMRGQRPDITDAARAGANTLVVEVTNTLINRVSGLEELPPVPGHLRPRLGGDRRRESSPSRRLLGFEPLPPSGLMGPVTVEASREILIPIGSSENNSGK
jgi:hypothetical protein